MQFNVCVEDFTKYNYIVLLKEEQRNNARGQIYDFVEKITVQFSGKDTKWRLTWKSIRLRIDKLGVNRSHAPISYFQQYPGLYG